ncbi:hypothetical protein M758_4G104700 [Ceratodon purpureus]|nr:hypothetical protein M758_4G104700 [Ceratodon purpureus]
MPELLIYCSVLCILFVACIDYIGRVEISCGMSYGVPGEAEYSFRKNLVINLLPRTR